MADGGWDIGETVFIGANGERQAGDDDLNRREVEDGFYQFLLSFRDTDESFLYRYGEWAEVCVRAHDGRGQGKGAKIWGQRGDWFTADSGGGL